ncbi:hypothetical protein RvY_16479 [Ramazzottius varieornatus]|uniref:Tyr recombinase domain-containing protein n=1 Tax=Ramazzottius varieornatus TaxID=947166 RepID=A0A1D1W505_RAMVA|nr:hypothetical protein RvY_16479 [Ramazzottius varieornatus]
MVLDIIDNGADIGFNGPRYPRFTKNSATAREFSEVLLKSITKEVASGHSVGPFSSPPFPNFVVSSLGVREKKTGGHRIIMDLSRPFGDSVNDHISPEDYSLAFCFLHTKQISYSTAKVYLSGINNNFVEQGQESLLKHPDIARSLQGFKRLHPTPKDRRLPITLTTLRHMKQRLTSEPLISPLDKALFWSACTLAYSGYLRASEFTARRGPASHTLQFRDVKVKQQSISLLLRTSKTDQYAKGNKIRIPATGRSVCPVAAIREYLQLRPDTETQDGPFFVRLRSAPLTRSFFASTLKSCLSGFPNASRYSTHSFRIGAATEASRQGLNPDEIRQAGRWKSTCYAGYIRKKSHATGLNIYSNLLN